MGDSIASAEFRDALTEKSEIYSAIYAKLAKKRDTLGWSLEKAAARSGVSVSTISRIEHGEFKKVAAVNIAALCQAYGCSMDALFAVDVADAPDKEPTHTAFLEKENAELKETLLRVRKQKHQITAAFVVVTLLTIAWFVLIDGRNGNFGLIRYAAAFGDGGALPAWVGLLGAML